jgi:hypothetical protein
MSNWTIDIGRRVKRREIHSLFGGQRQGGISTPVNSRNILIFTDPKSGAKYGYDKHEGLREDGSYAYTGEGQVGDQSLLRGNKAIFESAQNGKTIRIFKVDDTFATYAGGFTLGEPAYEEKQALDINGDYRSVIVFNLIPINADLTLLPSYGGQQPEAKTTITSWFPPDWTSYSITQSAKSEIPVQASRVEFELESAFGAWLINDGRIVRNLSIKLGSVSIFPDLFDETTNTIFEAKKSASRGHVREAIGQVLDYQNNELLAGNARNCGLLLPGAPSKDLIVLCSKLDIEIYIPLDSDNFTSGFQKLV